MESYLQYLTEDADADAIVSGLQQNKSDNQEIDITELNNFVHTDDNTSINSSGVIIPNRSQAQQQQDKAKSSRPWTKNKRDTSAKYLENTAYRRTTFSKKSKGIKKYANDFPQQTGAEIKIVIYNPDNKKTQTYYTKNVSVPFGRESKHSTVKKSPAAAAAPPPLVHSPFKGLNLPINFHNYLLSSSSGAASLPGASTITASSPKTSIKNPSSKDTSGKQNPSPTIDFQTHLPKPSSAVSSITTSPPTVNKIKHLPASSSKSKAKSTKKSTKTVKTGKKYITKKDLKKKLKTLVSTSELIDKSYMKSRPKRTIKNE